MPSPNRTLRSLFSPEHAATWLAAAVGVTLSLAAFWIVHRQLRVHRIEEFEWVAHNRSNALQGGIARALEGVEAIRDLCLASEDLGEDEFETFALSLTRRNRSISVLAWVPCVPGPERRAFEERAGRESPGFMIVEPSEGGWERAEERAVHHPVHHVHPREEGGPLHRGMDLGADRALIETLERSRSTLRMAVSPRIVLAHGHLGFAALLPVPLQESPSGYAVGVFRLDDLARTSIDVLEPRGVEFLIRDESAPEGERYLDFYSSRLSPERASQEEVWSDPVGPRLRQVFPVADREWSITSAATPQFRSAEAFQEGPWVVLGGGLLFSMALTFHLIRTKQTLLDRMRFQTALREREELFWQMTRTVDEFFWASDASRGQFLYVSPAFERVWGVPCERLYREPSSFLGAVHPEDRESAAEAMAAITRDGAASEMVCRVVQPDGSIRWIRASGFPIRDEDGEVYRIVGVGKDISERRLAEEALRESEGRLRALFNQSPDIIVIVNRKGHVVLLNRAIPDLSDECSVGKDSTALVPEQLRERYRQALDVVFEAGEIEHLEYVRPDSTWWELRIVPILRDEQVNAAMVIATDVTENRNLHRQAMRNAGLVSLGMLAAGVAHEINNPNNSILFNASLFRRVWRDASHILVRYFEENGDFTLGGLDFSETRETFPELLSDISRNAHRIQRIVENLKHLGSDRRSEPHGEIRLAGCIEAAVGILEGQIREFTDDFEIDLASDLPPIRGNRQELERVFVNLIMNALQALPDRSRAVRVGASLGEDGRSIAIAVRDEGCGIAPEDVDRIAEPFFTTRAERGGTGLGLFISNSTLERHRATLEFRSEPGEGTTAIVKFPVDACPTED